MEIRTELLERKGDIITLRMYDPLTHKAIERATVDGVVCGIYEPYDKEKITGLQRRHFFALCRDYENYTGYPLDGVENYFKLKFMERENLDEFPSLKRNRMSRRQASELLQFVIDQMIREEIPFQKQEFYQTMDISNMLYSLTMKRLCYICGKPHSDIHHATHLVGMGNNRRKHDHLKSTFMSLCRAHHNEVHAMGLDNFCEKYHVYPVSWIGQI